MDEYKTQMNNKAADNAAAKRYRELTETPVKILIPRLAVPTIISMLVTALYNGVDTFFVGRISTDAIAAVGLSFCIWRPTSAGFAELNGRDAERAATLQF